MSTNMARPREFTEEKKTEQITIRLTEREALAMYREASRRELPPAVLLRKAVRLGMSAILDASSSDENESISGFETLGDS
jgi:predicted DNA binding CopG/RHH family protein